MSFCVGSFLEDDLSFFVEQKDTYDLDIVRRSALDLRIIKLFSVHDFELLRVVDGICSDRF